MKCHSSPAPRCPNIAREDEDISEGIREILTSEGGNVRTSAECISLAPHERGGEVGVDCDEGEPLSVGSHVLLAVGRRPNSDDLGLEAAGVGDGQALEARPVGRHWKVQGGRP
jgi:pyruvate/2-oxoglutarate dehydrogenase complex dihydrolipoamide dehydrogenase (E3) component